MNIALVVLLLPACLSALKISDCGSKSLKNFDVKIDGDITFPGQIDITPSFEITETIGGPNLALDLEIKKKIFGFYAHIPCFGGYGSCEYESACQRSAMAIDAGTCPPEIASLGLSCKCPHQPMVSNGNTITIWLPKLPTIASTLTSGTYLLRAKIYDKVTGVVHVCYQGEEIKIG